MKIKLRNDDIKLKGWAAFFNKLIWILIFPIRRPVRFLIIIGILYLIPIFIGVKPSKVHLWYWEYIKEYAYKLTHEVGKTTKDKASDDMKLTPEKIKEDAKKEDVKTGKPRARKTFKKTPKDVQRQDALANKDIVRLPQAEKVVVEERKVVVPDEEIVVPKNVLYEQQQKEKTNKIDVQDSAVEKEEIKEVSKSSVANVVNVNKKLPLNYLEEVEYIKGNAEVSSANELLINGRYIIFYGIYVSPNSKKGIEAKNYLKMILDRKIVSCQIVAYTKQNVATGLCKAGDININQKLVDKGYSKNVAL